MSSQLTLKNVAYLVAKEFWNVRHNRPKSPGDLRRYVWQLGNTHNIEHLGSIEEIADMIFQDVNARIAKKLNAEQIHQEALAERIESIKKELLQKAKTHQTKQSLKQISNLQIIKTTPLGLPPLTTEQIQELYDYYSESWDVLRVPDVRPKHQRDKPIKTRIKEFVQTHPEELLSAEEFKRIIKDWNRNISEPVIKETITNRFPLKDNIKKYSLHKVGPRGAYMIDFMFHKKYVYLVAININTRYAMVEMTNVSASNENESQQRVLSKDAKTTSSYLRALKKMIDDVKFMNPIRHLTGDGESAFKSNLAMKFYEQYNITFHPVSRMKIEGKKGTDPLHSSLGLVDRLIRTIRDMIFNAELEMTPLAIKEMIRQYNNAPHRTLSQYIGFDVSPLMVQQDKNKEEYIVMKINKENIQTRMRNDFNIPVGSNVKVYNEKDVMGKRRVIAREGEIVGRNGVMYKVKTNLGIEIMPRYKIQTLIKYAL